MFSKNSFLTLLFLISGVSGFSQLLDLEEKKSVMNNGMEYGYIIKNEQVKTTKGEEYGRFEITLYISNKSGCTKIYADKSNFLSSESPNLLATFNCNNANGKRLTSKTGTVKARDFYIPVKLTENGKEITQTVKAGYVFRNGETLKANIIVLVPKEARPVIQCTVNSLSELQ